MSHTHVSAVNQSTNTSGSQGVYVCVVGLWLCVGPTPYCIKLWICLMCLTNICFWEHCILYTAVLLQAHLDFHCCNGMETQLISPCFSVSPEHSLQPASLEVPCDLQPPSTDLQTSSPSSDQQPPGSSPSPQNQQVLSSWVGPNSSNSTPNKRKPPQPQPKQPPRSPSLQRNNSR